jgi:hypothetical protein
MLMSHRKPMHVAPSEHDLPRGMERGKAYVAPDEEATLDRSAFLPNLTPETPDLRPRVPGLYPPARSARGIRVPGVFMRKL